MKSIHKLSLAAALLITAGCATAPDVHSPRNASAHLSSSQTFAVLPVAVDPSVPPATARAVVDAAEGGARDTLRALGYSETNRENADLVFYLHGKSMAPLALGNWDYQPAPSQFGMSSKDVEAWARRRIYVETYDNHSKRQVWMGWIECSCRGIDPERVQHEIQRIVATFPPQAKA